MTGLVDTSTTRSFRAACQAGCRLSMERHQILDLLALARACSFFLCLRKYAAIRGNRDSVTTFPLASNTLTMYVPVQRTLLFWIECALTNGNKRPRSIASSRRDPRKMSLQPVADPTRIVHPASSIFGKRCRAAFTVFVAAESRVSKRGEVDGRNVLTTLLPDGAILSTPAMEQIRVGPLRPF